LPQWRNSAGENGESPLENADNWLIVKDKNGRKGRRETKNATGGPVLAGTFTIYRSNE
jgi:hypothetical protein